MNLNELGEDLGINFNKVAAISDKIEINRNLSEQNRNTCLTGGLHKIREFSRKKRPPGRGHARFMETLIINEL